MAEVDVKEALEKLNLPGLKIRSVMKQDVQGALQKGWLEDQQP